MIIERQNKALSHIPNLVFGNKPADDGNLIFSYQDGLDFLEKYPEATSFVKKFIGSSELMKGEHRYCLWLEEKDRALWSKIPAVMQHVEACAV